MLACLDFDKAKTKNLNFIFYFFCYLCGEYDATYGTQVVCVLIFGYVYPYQCFSSLSYFYHEKTNCFS